MAVYNNLDGTLKNELSIGKSNKVKFENSSGKLNIKTNDITRLSIDQSTGALSLPGGEYVYLRGDATTDGSVRYSSQSSGTVLFEKREVGNWVILHSDSLSGPGMLEVPVITDNGNGKINVASATVALCQGASWSGVLTKYNLAAQTNMELTDNNINYLIANYNAGVPRFELTTSPNDINGSTKVLAANMYRTGFAIHFIPVNWGLSPASRIVDRLVNTVRFERSSGLTVSETAGNVINVTTGVVWYGSKAIVEAPTTSAASNAILYYLTGGTTWNETTVSTYNNSQYNNTTTGLVTLTADKQHNVNWIYRFIDGDSLPKIGIVLSPMEYDTLGAASVSEVPAIPTILSRHAILIGRIIVKKGTPATAAQIDSAFDQHFSMAAISNHNNLSGLQGGVADEYYHLTNTEHSSVTYGPSSATDNALAKFDLTTGKIIQNSGVIVDDNNNTGIGQTSFGTNATKTLALSTGVAPTTSPTDAIQIYSKDYTAGNAVPTFRTENGTEIQLNQNLATSASPSFSGLTIDTLSNFVKASAGVLSSSTIDPDVIASDIHFATGMMSRDDNTISFDAGTTTFTIAPTGTNFSFYSSGVKYTKTTQTLDLSTVVGWAANTLIYVSFNPSGVLVGVSSVWAVNNSVVPVATVFWNGSAGIVGDERHNVNRSSGGTWHKWAHLGFGTRYISGLNGTFTSSATTIASGAIEDEDIIISIDTQTSMQIWYAAPGNTTMTADGVLNTSALITTGALKYDAAGTITSVTSNFYVRNFIYATNNITNPIACIIGQAEHSNINDARISSFPTQPSYISAETRLLYTTIWQNVGGTPTFVESTDYRTAPTAPNGALSIRPIFLDELADVDAPTPSLDQVLRWNGTTWTNGTPSTSSASVGIDFFNATPIILATGANNQRQLLTYSKIPITTAQQTTTSTANTTNVPIYVSSFLYNTALGRTTIDAGIWDFQTFAGVSSIGNGRINTIINNMYQVIEPVGTLSTTTVTTTSRTVTITGSTPFLAGDATANITTCGYIQTPNALFEITGFTNTGVVTIACISTYTNETGIASGSWKLWRKLFGANTPAITSITPLVQTLNVSSAQPAFTINATDKLGSIMFCNTTTNNSTIFTTYYNGSINNSHVSTPLVTLHNNLAGLQGGTANEYYHLTSAQSTSFPNLTVGPASATDNALARFDLTTGKIIQNSGVIVDDNNNTGIGQTIFGTNATKTLALSTGVAPTSSPTDAFQMYSKDLAAGNAVPTFRTENGTEIQLNQSLTTTSNVTFGNLTAIYKGITSQVGVTSTLTATMTHVEQTVGSIITSLWAAPTTGDIVTIKNNSSGVNTVSGNGKNIEAFSTWTLNAGEAITLIYNGSIWIIDGVGNVLIMTEQWTTAPVTYNSTGIKGQFAYDNIYKYECVAINTWVRYAVERSF